jgi:hypothetical protein
MGRDKHFRQHTREAAFTSLWVLEDWGLAWTVNLARGRLEFDRRPAKHPDLTLTWQSGARFLDHAETGISSPDEFQLEGDVSSRRVLEAVCTAFFRALGNVIRYPVDDNGESLL